MKWVRGLLWRFIVVLNFMLASIHSFGQDHSEDPALSVLRSSIEKILIDTHTPGVGIAIVTKSGPVWISAHFRENEHLMKECQAAERAYTFQDCFNLEDVCGAVYLEIRGARQAESGG